MVILCVLEGGTMLLTWHLLKWFYDFTISPSFLNLEMSHLFSASARLTVLKTGNKDVVWFPLQNWHGPLGDIKQSFRRIPLFTQQIENWTHVSLFLFSFKWYLFVKYGALYIWQSYNSHYNCYNWFIGVFHEIYLSFL